MWRPTLLQQRFIDTAVDFACRGKRLVLKDIAVAIAVDDTRPSKWRRDPRFTDALTEAIAREHKHLSVAARTSLYNAAIAGNLAAFDRIYRVEQDLAQLQRPVIDAGGMPAPGADVGGVHIHVHGIPERQPMSALPPPLTLPAASAAPPPPAK